MELRFVGHATVLLEVDGARILTDPFLRSRLGPLERHGPVPDPAELGPVDVVLVSHGHPDHLDRASLQALRGRPTVVVPPGLGAVVTRWVTGDVLELPVGARTRVGPVTIEGVEARHWVTPGAPPAAPQGYLIEAGTRVWFAGDTGRFEGLRALTGRVDVALVPVATWGPHRGPGHLGPRSAAEVIASIGAAVAVPIHWATLYPRALHRILRAPLHEPGDRFAAHLAASGSTVDARVLRPGDATSIAVRRGP